MQAVLIYPHQLHSNHPALGCAQTVVFVEDPLFFQQFSFHSKKLLLHRLSMNQFARKLRDAGRRVITFSSGDLRHSGDVADKLKDLGVSRVHLVEPGDDWLAQRLRIAFKRLQIEANFKPDPGFLTPLTEFESYSCGVKKWYFTEFYVAQRKRLRILLDSSDKPVGGKWSFDPANRKKLTKDILVPKIAWPKSSRGAGRVAQQLACEFPKALGDFSEFHYATTADQARRFLTDFLEHRLANFGEYEDAIEPAEPFLFHSLLTPSLNIGLLTPNEVVEAALEYSDRVPLNSLEGFIRQVIGWREYMRGVYHFLGRRQRTSNFWNHQHPMPKAFYSATTGIEPVDTVIRRVLKYAYCHHIERLMVLGNFMLLCEISPNAVYQWFMELFIDAYDWVMVPNVYGMSQFADGGLITTKPYISGSAYILKMSHFKRGPWCEIWDALYWRFIDKHRNFFASNPRMSVMVSQLDRMGDKLTVHHRVADDFLSRLHS